ncbi:putative receptor protein kinase ZmPK1 [Sorghum bicolor]|uniref:Receptor-like serine/threonine-protein kinase n=1 Tax=Sorghum bicolor TaxID=4558 RepID=A0A1W0VYV0_SORBI|nr:putative receptor protein kinase ZmPK1 [Sorghum bicolor]OQU87306.1 hypothetical protein SORBI_3003G251600 [Sorghum bicolor]|eukprot:XP_002458291.2 putative receptor protein kinase ZmPK1 [Sorghum bicolor]
MALHLAYMLVSMPAKQCRMLRKLPRLAILISLLSLLLRSSASASAQHTLGPGSSLSVEDHARPFLVSPDATFSCGFLDAGDNAFSFSVWYTAAANKTAVWTANPDAAVNGRGSRISFRHDGGLALSGANGTTVWETKTSGAGLSVSLLNSGNLVVSDPSSGGGRTLWQSFDWPTDTLVPSQRLTKNTTLVSRFFFLYFDNDNVLRLRYDGSDISSIYWPNPDYGVFPNGRTAYNSSRIAVLDDTGVFLSSDNLRVVAADLGVPGVKRRLTIDPDGNLRIYSLDPSTGAWTATWAAMAQACSAHGLCGRNAMCVYQPSLRCSCVPGHEMVDRHDWRQGCRPMFGVTNCSQQAAVPEQEQRLKFVVVPHTDFYGYDVGYNKTVTFEHCKKLCLEMCSCAAFSYRPFEGGGLCYPKGFLYNGYTSPNFQGNIYLKVPIDFDASAQSVSARSSEGLACNPDGPEIVQGNPDTFQTSRNNARWSYLFAFAGVLGVLDIIFIATSWWFLSSKQSIPSSLEAGYRMVTGQFRRFTYGELKDATGNFKEELGRGGSGVVYRGVLDKGKKVVAVKKLTNVAGGDEEFWAEMTLIGRINHINLVRIWGFCSQGKHRLLVYEYVENQSLDRHLFDTDRTTPLPWRERYRIALGTARGLAYLHHECLEWVIHCDVKPENILLTREFDAKIADFGLAKLSKRNDGAGGDGMQLSHMRGTTGYMAPEWALNVPINAKVDVYSYGVVLLEMVMGCRVCDQTTAGGERLEMAQIAQALRQVVASGNVVPLVDGRLQGQFNPRQALEMVRISLSCVEDRSNRPTMDDVAKALTACDDEDEHPAYK